MDKTPSPVTLAAALALPLPPGRRSAEVFRDGSLELRVYAPTGHDPQTPHDRDELYIVASAAATSASVTSGARAIRAISCSRPRTRPTEDFSPDFAVWVIFYGPTK